MNFRKKFQMASTLPSFSENCIAIFFDKRPKKPFIKVLGLYKGPRSCSHDNQELSSTCVLSYHTYVWLNHANCFGFNHNIILGWLNYPHQWKSYHEDQPASFSKSNSVAFLLCYMTIHFTQPTVPTWWYNSSSKDIDPAFDCWFPQALSDFT